MKSEQGGISVMFAALLSFMLLGLMIFQTNSNRSGGGGCGKSHKSNQNINQNVKGNRNVNSATNNATPGPTPGTSPSPSASASPSPSIFP